MKSNNKKYWEKRHQEYAAKDWIAKTTIFAQQTVKYFPKKGELIDLSAGQGQDSRFFAEQGSSVTSQDYSEYALDVSKKKAEAAGIKMAFNQCDLAEPLPFPDETFDIAYSHLGLHYFDEPTTAKLFTEIHRILKKDGVFAMILNPAEDPEIAEDKQEEISRNYYRTFKGLFKRYFSAKDVQHFTAGLFEPLLLDSKGETYKDGFATLIRFIGKKNA